MPERLSSWFEVVRLHPDVETGQLTRSTFAIDFGGVLANSKGIPLVYRDSRAFWQATELTSGIRRLLEEVLSRLSGQPGDRVLQLRSPFGGGKSHVLLALYHAIRDRQAFEEAISEANALPKLDKVRIAGMDGEKFDPISGTEINKVRIYTLWGVLAAQLGCFDLIREQETSKVAPGGETVQKILGEKPTLILLDEVLRYVEKAMGITIGESNLGRQSLEFLQTLTTEVANSTKAVMVYSLQASAREAFDNIGLLTMLDHLTARVDAKREPVIGDEILYVLKKRLLSDPLPSEFARQVAKATAQSVTQWRISEAPDEGARRLAQDEQIRFTQRLETAYPFHVGLIDLMKERWASIPDFERTRGALRFLAAVLHKAKRLSKHSLLVGPGDVPLDDADVRNAFFTEVGQREHFQSVLEHDLTGPNARVRRIDEQLAQQNPGLAAVRPATRMATAILMYSFGGLHREEEKGEILPSGVTEKELLEVCLSPEIDNITAQSVLKYLKDECLYLHYDGVRYCFKTIPNVNKILEDESENVQREEVRDFIRRKLEERIGQVTNAAIVWPEESSKIPDAEPRFLLAYLPPGFAEKSGSEQQQIALDMLTQYGSQPRRFRNGLGLAVPDRRQLEGLRRAAKYLLAVERVRAKKTSYRLTRDQMDQLKEREDTEKSGLESGLRTMYHAVLLLKIEGGQPVLDKVEIGGRPLREQGIHERLIELLKNVSGKLFDSIRPQKILTLMRIGNGEDERKAVETLTTRDAFFEILDFPRLTDEKVIAEAIAQGIEDGTFAFALKNRVREELGQYHVKRDDAFLQRSVSIDEIDLETGIILLPECVTDQSIMPSPIGPGIQPTVVTPQPPSPGAPTPSPPESVPRDKVQTVRLDMRLNRQSLYKTFDALGNLAGKTGEIRVIVEANSADGIERNWLRNAVKEPLEEAGIEIDITESSTTPRLKSGA